MDIEHIRATHREVEKNFPKKCSGGVEYRNQREYNQRTEELIPPTHMGLFGDDVLFFRNCKCQSTLTINVSGKAFGIDRARQTAQQQGKTIEHVLQEHRDKYNEAVEQGLISSSDFPQL